MSQVRWLTPSPDAAHTASNSPRSDAAHAGQHGKTSQKAGDTAAPEHGAHSGQHGSKNTHYAWTAAQSPPSCATNQASTTKPTGSTPTPSKANAAATATPSSQLGKVERREGRGVSATARRLDGHRPGGQAHTEGAKSTFYLAVGTCI